MKNKGHVTMIYRLVFATLLTFGLIEASSATTCALSDVTIDGMDALSCGWTGGSQNDNVGGMSQPGDWSVNVDGAGDTFGDLVWNAYYRQEIEEGIDPPNDTTTTPMWSRMDDLPGDNPDVANGQPIDLQFTGYTGDFGDGSGFSSGNFTVDGRSPGGELLVVLKTNDFDYHWYLFNKVGDDLAGTWDTSGVFGGKNLSHMTVYEIGTSDNGGPPQLVPVPAAVWLFGSGLIGLVGVARRRKL